MRAFPRVIERVEAVAGVKLHSWLVGEDGEPASERRVSERTEGKEERTDLIPEEGEASSTTTSF